MIDTSFIPFLILVAVILVPLLIFVAIGSSALDLNDKRIARNRKNMGCTVEYMTEKQANGVTYNKSRVLDQNGVPVTNWQGFTPTGVRNEMWHLARGKDIR